MRLATLLVVTGLGLGVLAPAGGVISAADTYDVEIDPASFRGADGNPYPIDNPCFPLIPGTTYIYAGMEPEGFVVNEYTITYETKEIMGVTCTVVSDIYWLLHPNTGQWELREVTTDWHAQDVLGNVWYFGEESTEKNDGEDEDDDNDDFWEDDGSWQAGEDGALPGIVMPASPIIGEAYRQEFYAGVAEDWAKVLRTNARVSTEFGDFSGCLKIKEWSTVEKGEVEAKYYSHGVGLVLTVGKGGKCVSELVDVILF